MNHPRAYRLLMLALVLLLPTGCAHMLYSDDALARRLDGQLKEGRYSSVLDTLDSLPPERAAQRLFRRKRSEANAKLRSYEQTTITRATELQEQGRWREAHALYSDALTRVPATSPIQGEWKKLQQMEAGELARLREQSYYIRAKYLIETIALLSQGEERVSTGDVDGTSLDNYIREAKLLSRNLHQIGKQALQEKDYTTAIRGFQLARRLSPDDAAIEQSIQAIREQTEVMAQYVVTLKRQAAGYYGAESYELALKTWEEAQGYAPDDREIQEKIERVKRVLDSLQQIGQKRP